MENISGEVRSVKLDMEACSVCFTAGEGTGLKGVEYTGDKKLEPGDILLSPGTHTAMVVESPNEIGEEAAVKAAKEAEKAAAAKAKAKAKSKSKGKAKAKTIKYKAGKNYTLKMVLNVRTGPGKNFPNVKRKNLTKDGKKHATKSKYGRLKKGTVVTCLKVKGEWMRIPSGWICCKPGNLK